MTDLPRHMTPDEFREHGHTVIDWVADYMAGLDARPVMSTASPGDIRAALPERPPQDPEPFGAVLADLERVIMPGITHWQSPNFYGFFSGNSSGPSVLGELVSAGLGVQGMMWATSPACTELETHMLDWMIDLCALPERFRSNRAGGGVIQESASSSTLCALLAARERAGGIGGLDRYVVYASNQAHSSVEKGARIAGIPPDRFRMIEVDAAHALRPDALAAAIAADVATGLVPMAIVATTGTTSSTAIEPVEAMADVAEQYGVWLHVDSAFAGSAAVCPELRFVNAGLERADSYVFNPHKWLLTNFDCSLLYVADREPLLDALSILPEYLRNEASDGGSVIDYRDWQVSLGRRFRSLKLWFVIRHYGASGLQAHIRGHVAMARRFAASVEQHPDFDVVAPVPLSLVCFRHRGGDDVNKAILEAVNASGEIFLTHTVLDGKHTLRLAIGSPATEQRHVDAAWQAIVAAAPSGQPG
ncbi:MAG: pyridoxal-dependent decarboxylase [Acidimicrobiia bacterium]|nr:pyridoxal-dependent decarboxylase [Acidimicrobiia bacterium]